VGDVAERSTVINTVAAQEFGSDYTDPFDVAAVGARVEWRRSETVVLSLVGAAERHRPLAVHARPVSGPFEPPIPADWEDVVRGVLRYERPATPWVAGTLAAHAELRGQTSIDGSGRSSGRLAGDADLVLPFGGGLRAIRSWTLAAATVGGRVAP